MLARMRPFFLSLAIALSVSPAFVRAQVTVDIRVGFPTPPPLVVVSPGIQVVPDYGEEVFFVDGWYWLRRDTVWYRTRDHRGGWVVVQPRYVPASLVRLPPGQYKHWHKAEEKAEKRAWKADQKAWKEEEKAERKANKGSKHRD
jgi:hypothetical protein